ncbi:unnamed protein product [Cylicostephanus goldi]|uniref:Uncharacterized protein n=1 Tax=Cylicostephanus goldi TaxID=71465 RepID=A0A3P6R421_CYLGO|nr:unnamed protein product [Cylicostephanus goldi]
MQYEYNLMGVGVMSRFPYVSLGSCMGLDCSKPGAELANGSADISIKTINQEIPRQEQVDFTVATGIVYLGYYIKENTQVEVGDYLAGAFPGTVGEHFIT